MENQIMGVFASNYTTDGDLEAGVILYNPQILFYRVGLFVNRRFVFDNINRYRLYTMLKIPVYNLQPYGDDLVMFDIIKDMHGANERFVVLDVELDISNLVQRLNSLYEKIILNTKLIPMLYTNLDFINRYRLRNSLLITMYPLWFANYANKMVNPKWPAGVAVWQNKPKLYYRNNVVINLTSEIILKPELFGLKDVENGND